MNLDKTQFDSPQKETRRSSILKNRTDNKEGIKQQPKGLSTTIRHSVRFKERNQQQNHVRQFTQSNVKSKEEQLKRSICPNERVATDQSYIKWAFFKDVSNINYLYSNVLMKAGQNCRKMSEKADHKQLIQMNKAIQELVNENKKLKEQIEVKHRIQNDLNQLSEYLHCSIDDLINKNKLQSFIEDYESKQEQWTKFQERYRNIGEFPKPKIGGLTQAQTRQKEKKCQALRRKIDREKNAIKKLQKEEAQLLKNLYKHQKDIAINERLSSALKLKINQIQIDNEYKFSRTRAKSTCKQNQNKENVQPVEQVKHSKINNRQNLKSKVSLAKLLKKK